MNKFITSGAGLILALTLAGSAFAQTLPSPDPGPRTAAPAAQAPAATTTTSSDSASFVVLSDLVPPCKEDPAAVKRGDAYCAVPRAAVPAGIGKDSPVLDRDRFVRMYPQMGVQGYDAIARSNQELCSVVNETIVNIANLDQMFAVAGDEYQLIHDVYNQLPDSVKRSTRVMTISQAVQAGALCALSAGNYCLAVVFNAVGNIFVSQTSKQLQLANIRLSVANIVVTKLNIWSNRITLRLDTMWMGAYAPACFRLGHTSFLSLPPLPEIPALPKGFGGKPSSGGRPQ